jgi:biopolymer transport protein ExbB
MNITTVLIIIPIVAFSIISGAIIVERFLFFRRNRINLLLYRKFLPANLSGLKEHVSEQVEHHLFSGMLSRLFSYSAMTRDEIREFLDSSFSEVYLQYNKRVGMLGIFAKLSTLLGLFGTVTGMIMAFNNIVSQGISTASIVAGGISAALITTAIGLSVAIPTTFFHDFFMHKIDDEIKKMEIIVSDILVSLYKIKRSRV